MARHSPFSGFLKKKIALASVVLFSTGCGASMEAIYEGDVRFEHCMALDARPDVKPSMRRACWAEWMAFYTYGQTSDRVQHAQMRIEQLSDPGELAPGDQPRSAYESRGRAVGFAPGAEDRARRHAVCSGTCEAVREDCARSCSNGGCERTCSMGFQRCMLTCG